MREDLVRGYYDKRAQEEWERFDRHRMEFAISMRLLSARLPSSGRILDCGGGPGRYSIWLAAQGYDVTLFDLSEACLNKAEAEAEAAGVSLSYELGTATDLRRFDSAGFDAVLLMGPLYHLRRLEDRQAAVNEAARVLKPGGRLAASFITRTAPLRFTAKMEAARVRELYEPMLNVIRQGYDESFPPADDDHFHAYFAHPSEVEPLLQTAGLDPAGMFAVEGFVVLIDEAVNALQGDEWDAWVDVNLGLAADPSLLMAADHLLAFATKA
jgi:2-polyprenyl-3-methyl-5-hydroxy-6-metoxy-1,4-benzoquinol methylase